MRRLMFRHIHSCASRNSFLPRFDFGLASPSEPTANASACCQADRWQRQAHEGCCRNCHRASRTLRLRNA